MGKLVTSEKFWAVENSTCGKFPYLKHFPWRKTFADGKFPLLKNSNWQKIGTSKFFCDQRKLAGGNFLLLGGNFEECRPLPQSPIFLVWDRNGVRKSTSQKLANNLNPMIMKGRIACEVGSADEILLTEMVFNGLFTELDPSQTAAILSCFVCDEKTNDFPKLTEKLSGPLRKMNEMAI